MKDRYSEKVKEILAAFDREDWTLAVNLSGEFLAEADGRYAAKLNCGQNADMELDIFGLAASLHCLSLLYACEIKMLLSTSLACMYQIEQNGYKTIGIEESLMIISATALSAHAEYVSFAMEELEPDEELKDHCFTMGRYIASYCYYLYNKVNKEMPESPYTGIVYTILQESKDFFKIDTPTIEVCGDQMNPSKDGMGIMADLLGRALSLGFFDEK